MTLWISGAVVSTQLFQEPDEKNPGFFELWDSTPPTNPEMVKIADTSETQKYTYIISFIFKIEKKFKAFDDQSYSERLNYFQHKSYQKRHFLLR